MFVLVYLSFSYFVHWNFESNMEYLVGLFFHHIMHRSNVWCACNSIQKRVQCNIYFGLKPSSIYLFVCCILSLPLKFITFIYNLIDDLFSFNWTYGKLDACSDGTNVHASHPQMAVESVFTVCILWTKFQSEMEHQLVWSKFEMMQTRMWTHCTLWRQTVG